MTTRERLFLLYLGDTQPTKYWSIWVALFAAMGLMLRAGDSGHPDTDLLIDLMPGWAWMLLLVYMMATRTITILWRSGTVWTRIITPLLSICVWGFFFSAQFVAPNFGLGLLFLVPALQETWILSRVFWDEELLWK